jgi:V/A-type H+-transporting ATPase subunit C
MDKHAYTIGKIRSLEARMVDETKLIRIVDADDFESAFQILNETIYVKHMTFLANPFDYEELLSLEAEHTKRFLLQLASGSEILKVLYEKYDFHNIKLLLKSRFYPISDPSGISKIGNIPFETLKEYIIKNVRPFFSPLRETIDKAVVIFGKGRNFRDIEFYLDGSYLKRLKAIASADTIPLFEKYVSYYTDLLDIKRNIFEGEKPEEILAKYHYKDFYPAINSGIQAFKQGGSFAIFERDVENFLLDNFRKAKYFAFGLEPLIGYFLAKEVEMKTLRFIFICKKNFISVEEIKNCVRRTYV